MADAPGAPAAGSKMGFLGRKIGPVPIWLIAVAAVGAYYWYTHYGPGKPAPADTTATTTPAGPEIIEVSGPAGPAGARGPRGPRGPAPKPSAKVAVPNVVGDTYKEGSKKITAAGLRGQRSSPYVGKVQSESPHAGTKVARGTVVTLRGKPWQAPKRGKQPKTAAPAAAAAPMTTGDVYGAMPTATPGGDTYQSGYPAAAEMGAASVAAAV